MEYDQLLGEYQEQQAEAVKVLSERGRMDYEDLKDELQFEDNFDTEREAHSAMRAVLRGLSWNGLAERYVTEHGGYEYGVSEDVAAEDS